jgi:tetratricopeptide (TPR) repeat protein
MVQADGHRAAHLYRRVASDTGAAGTVRSEACARLGDFRYAAGEYDEACGWYKEAWTLDPRPGFARLYARCAIARGDIEEAEAVLVPLTHSDEPSISAMSWYYLGSASMARGDYGQAVKYLANASRGSGEEFAAAARAAAGEATALSTDTKTERQAFADTAERQPGGKTGPGPYSLQVGAFGSVENARRFREEMKEKVDDVTISSTTAGGVTLYRVRIGSFRSREDAEVFGAAKLKKHGIGYHITGGTEQ